MIGIVIVSHSARLAEGVCELAQQMGQGRVPLAAAGGTADPMHPIGTDTLKVLEAIQAVYSDDGVLVLMDLGSALLSAETALELLDEARRAKVRLCAAPLVEGAVLAVAQVAAGANLEEAAREAQGALAGKAAQLQPTSTAQGPRLGAAPGHMTVLTVANPLGLHARPAAQFARTARRFRAHVTVRNVTEGTGPVEAGSINGLLSLGVRQGHQLALSAEGAEAREALAALTALIEAGLGETDGAASVTPSSALPNEAEASELVGVGASPGIATGPLLHLRSAPIEVAGRLAGDPQSEEQRLRAALRGAREETQGLLGWARAQAGEAEAGIFDAQLLFLEDPALVEGASRRIVEGATAEGAWQAAVEEWAGRLRGLTDSYLAGRATDVADVGRRVLSRLVGAPAASVSPEPAIVAAHDLTPSEVRELERGRVLGLVLEGGSANAHSLILARALGIPAVVGLGAELATLAEGTPVALDGQQGRLWVRPNERLTQKLEQGRAAWLAGRQAAQAARHRPAITRDGQRICVLANIGSVSEARAAAEAGAEGVGVLRSEFLFLDRHTAPDEEEQMAAYRAIAEALDGRPLTIRTLDIGGDKALPYLPIGAEANPFLGRRGIRVSLGQPDLLGVQLRAALRAGAGHPIKLLLPMVSSADEVRAVRALLDGARAELRRAGLPFAGDVPLGIMIEVPAAVEVAEQLAAVADFFSIGSNDLAQYIMAADRTNPRVAALADALEPAVLRSIGRAVQAARQAGIGVSLCGELAADPLAQPLLLGLGLEELSMNAPAIAEVKQTIAGLSRVESQVVAAAVLALDSGRAVREYLQSVTGNPVDGPC